MLKSFEWEYNGKKREVGCQVGEEGRDGIEAQLETSLGREDKNKLYFSVVIVTEIEDEEQRRKQRQDDK